MHESQLHTASQSTDERWTDTWFWNAIDPRTGTVVCLHISWLPARGVGQQVMSLVVDGRMRRIREVTTEPFRSDSIEVDRSDIEAGVRFRAPSLGVDIDWTPFHPAVDFGHLLHVDRDMELGHLEGGGRGLGTIGGVPFAGRGFRDRSFGPRDLRSVGRHWAIGAVGLERDLVITANVMWKADQPIDSPPTIFLGCRVEGADFDVYGKGTTIERQRDGTPSRISLPDGIDLTLDLATAWGETHFVPDPNSANRDDVSDAPAYALRDIFLPIESPQLGHLVGWYEEGVLWRN